MTKVRIVQGKDRWPHLGIKRELYNGYICHIKKRKTKGALEMARKALKKEHREWKIGRERVRIRDTLGMKILKRHEEDQGRCLVQNHETHRVGKDSGKENRMTSK